MNARMFAEPLATILAAVAVASGLACRGPVGQVQADVRCKGAGDVVHCDVEETHGIQPAQACWDLNYKCVNGKKAKGSYCEEVKNGLTVGHDIPVSSIDGIDGCDQIEKMDVVNFKLNVH